MQVWCYVGAVRRFAVNGDDTSGGDTPGEDVPEVLSLLVTLRKRLNSVPTTLSSSPRALDNHRLCWVRTCAS